MINSPTGSIHFWPINSLFFFQNSILFLLIFIIVVKWKNLVLWSSVGSNFILNSCLLWRSHSLTLVRLMFSSIYSSFIDFVNSFSLNWIKPNMFLFHHPQSSCWLFFFFFLFARMYWGISLIPFSQNFVMTLVQASLKKKGLGPPLSLPFVSIRLVVWGYGLEVFNQDSSNATGTNYFTIIFKLLIWQILTGSRLDPLLTSFFYLLITTHYFNCL